MKFKQFIYLSITILALGCKNTKSIVVTPQDYQASIDNVTQIIIHDIFSPPVASRIYTYPNIAAFEVIAQHSKKYKSLQKQLNGLDSIPIMDEKTGINKNVAALVAHLEVSKALVFSEEKIEIYRDSLYSSWKQINEHEFEVSKVYGLQVADHIKKWMAKDNYKQTRTMPKFSVFNSQPGRWQPTPPAYIEAVEPNWREIRTLVLDSAAQFKPSAPYAFSTDKNSPFFKQVMEVYQIDKKIRANGDASNEIAIAQFWDCNPYVTVNQGHLMFAKKKITPGGHWMGITKIACKTAKADFEKTIYAYTVTSIGLFDAFISCWDEKYRSNVVRPETVINKNIDENWMPILQTPPFPEYPSGHSVVSTCSASLLSSVFGENFNYLDDSEKAYGLPDRKFKSFKEAAKEAAISRFYGGIHYRAAIENGIVQGKDIGDYIVSRVQFLK